MSFGQEDINGLFKQGYEKNKGQGEQMEKKGATAQKQRATSPLVEKVEFAPLHKRGKIIGKKKTEMHLFDDIPLLISGELGQARITVRELLKLKEGSVLKLDKMAGETASILVNEHYLGQAEVVVISDRFGLRVTAIGEEDIRSVKKEVLKKSLPSRQPSTENRQEGE